MNQTRVPSIHITKSDLLKVIRTVLDDDRYDHEDIVEQIMTLSKSKAITSRTLTLSKALMEKKFNKLLKASNDDTFKFIKLLQMTRRTLKHRGLTEIKENSRDWLTCKDICNNAINFCNDFELKKEEGFVTYIKIGILLTQKFYLPKLLSLHEAICNHYEAMRELNKDKTPQDTKILHNLFQRRIIDKIGTSQDYSNKPDKYQYFVKAKNLANELGISYHQFIDAQFAAFEWRSSIPEPVQMTGDKARDRCLKYAFENNLQIKLPGTKKINFKNVRDANNKDK